MEEVVLTGKKCSNHFCWDRLIQWCRMISETNYLYAVIAAPNKLTAPSIHSNQSVSLSVPRNMPQVQDIAAAKTQ